MKVIKRSGQEVDFNRKKIENAISKANTEVNEIHQLSNAQIQAIAMSIEKKSQETGRAFSVEEIQDMVETGIMEMRGYEVAQKYVRYRYKRELARKTNTTDEEILELVERNNEEVKQENSNKNPIINSTQRDYVAGAVSKDLTLRVLLPNDIVQAHQEGAIHFHDADYFISHEHNCFNVNTRFVTDEGVVSFKSCYDGECVTVLDKDGVWRKATVHKYEPQKMYKVELSSARSSKTIICTKDHRWILKDGSVTTNLEEGMVLYPLHNAETLEYEVDTKEKAIAFAIGFAIGDGTDTPRGYLRVRLCGHKTKYTNIFKMAGFSVTAPSGLNGDLQAAKYGISKQSFLSNKIWKFMSPTSKCYLFHGLYAADGNVSYNRLATVDDRISELIRDISATAGYHISSEDTVIRDTNYGKEKSITYFLFRKKQPDNFCWHVKKISSYYGNTLQEAWCVEEPITHTFTLENGVVTGNCELVNLKDMLENGTVISNTKIETPHSFATACNIATQIVAQVASNTYGGQSISLAHLAPYVDVSRQKIRKQVREEMSECSMDITDENVEKIVEKRLHREIVAGIQTINYQLVTLMTTNGQTPFVTLWMYLDEVPEARTRDDLAIIIEEVLNQRIKGLPDESGAWVTPAFPKLIYVLDEDNITEGSKYWDLTVLAAKCTAKRLVPDYVSAKIMKELKGDVYPPMGCRSFLTPDTVGLNSDGSHKYYGRFNQGVVTINLPYIACLSDGDMDKFWSILDDYLELCHRALRCRHERLKGTPSDVAPILWQHGALAHLKKGETIDKLLYNNYSTISLGYAGLYEMCMRMTGKSHTDPVAKPFAMEVMQHLNDKCAQWRAEENISYSIYGTPMESGTYKFAKALQKRFGIIKNVSDHNYITNSYHVVVRENIDAFSKLSFESEFQAMSPGGAISYVEVPDMQNNIPAVLSIMKHIYNTIIYAELNTKSDHCEVCGYDGEIQIIEKDSKLAWMCPKCGCTDQSKMHVTRRTCGYIGTNYWNQGRTQEIKERVLHVSNKQLSISE